MPVYEEKLISPLAVRFTQEHIKTIFRDGHIVEETAAQIEVRPSDSEDYDLVLHAPFPQIEIIRWGHSQCGAGSTGHWFTLDNRRLYCLQVAAAKAWPRRVAAKVDILYADPGAVRRKFDSTTLGASVTVSHSCKDAPLFRWDWRLEVQRGELPAQQSGFDANFTSETNTTNGDAVAGESQAWKTIAGDDEKITVDKLSDACGGSNSILARALEFEHDSERTHIRGNGSSLAKGAEQSATPSTADTSEEGDTADGAIWYDEYVWRPRTPRGWRTGCNGAKRAADFNAAYESEEGIAQTAQALEEIKWQLRSCSWDGKLRIPSWKDRYGQCLGPIRKFLKAHPEVCTIVEAEDGTFTVWRAEVTEAEEEERSAQATKALQEIRRQLRAPNWDGKLRVTNWKVRYGQSLGSIRKFLEAHPEVCTLVYADDGTFKVYKADASNKEGAADTEMPAYGDGSSADAEALTAQASKEIRSQLDPTCKACSVKIKDWNGRYGATLGPFKAFLREHADEFAIVPDAGRLFKVALVAGGA